jgi:hypothetical protein
MALALSGELMRDVKKLVDGSHIGFGQDYWLCYKSREMGLCNVIDGRVSVYHPEGIGYNEKLAHDQMEKSFTEKFGEDFRQTVFNYDERYEFNCLGKLSDLRSPVGFEAREDGYFMRNGENNSEKINLVTVDNGWGVDEFIRMVDKFKDQVNPILMQKGLSTLEHLPERGIDVWKHDRIDDLMEIADIAYFPKVAQANVNEYEKMLEYGIPIVVYHAMDQGLIDHEKNGYHFGDESWAEAWIAKLINEPEARDAIRLNAIPEISEDEVFNTLVETLEHEWLGKSVAETKEPVTKSAMGYVTVITPTYERDINIINRSIDCLKLQDCRNWNQVICSNGKYEQDVENLVKIADDGRIAYKHCKAPVGDFGNYARCDMLKGVDTKYVMFFDDDNVILPNYISTMIEAIESGDYDYAVCKIMHFGPLNESVTGPPPIVLDGSNISLYHIDTLQFLVKTDTMKEIGWDTTSYVSDGITLEKLKDRRGIQVREVLGVHT